MNTHLNNENSEGNTDVCTTSVLFLLLLGFKHVQHSGVSQKRNGTLMNK